MPPVSFQKSDKVKIQVVQQNIDPNNFEDKELPTDVHRVKYTMAGEVIYDAVRAYAKVDIFDAYYDKLRTIGEINEIKSGYGKIKPKLYGKIKTDD